MLTLADTKYFKVGGTGIVPLNIDIVSNPSTYLKFAVEDLNEILGERSLINALSNAKRALHFQLEILSKALGYNRQSISFPNLLEFCSKCGVVSPKILIKLNKKRNMMEHEYYVPTKEEAEDFTDIVELFLSATNYIIRHFPTDIELYDIRNYPEGLFQPSIEFTLQPYTGRLDIKYRYFNFPYDKLQDYIAVEKKKIEHKIAEKSQVGEEIELRENVDQIACKYVNQQHFKNTTYTFTVKDSSQYFEWVSFIMREYL